MQSFIFAGDGLPKTPQELARMRAMAEALAPSRAPKDIGEGIASIGNAILYRALMNKADKSERAGQDAATNAFTSLFGGDDIGSDPTTFTAADATAPSIKSPQDAIDASPQKLSPVSKNSIYSDFMSTVGGKVKNPYALAAIAATGDAESKFTPTNANRSWADPSLSGEHGMAGGILSWRNERLKNLYSFAATKGEKPGLISAKTQAEFFLNEDPNLIASLETAKSAEDAQRMMNNAWKFAGYDRPGGEAGRRIQLAGTYLPQFQNGDFRPVQVADNTSGISPGVATALRPRRRIDMNKAIRALADPFLTPQQRMAGQMIIKQQMDADQAEQEQLLKQSDPAYQVGLKKSEIELKNLENPQMSPGDKARIELDQKKFDTEQADKNRILPKDQAQLDLEKDKFEWEKSKPSAVWEKMSDGRLFNKQTGDIKDAGAGDSSETFKDASSLRKEMQQLPSYKNLASALPIYQSMSETAGRNTKASDLNLVYGLGKIMDPTSVVREGEMVMVKNTASLPDWLQGAISSINGGAALTPETRAAIMEEAFGRVTGYDKAFQQDAGMYKGIVDRNRFNPADVIPTFSPYSKWAADPNAGQVPGAGATATVQPNAGPVKGVVEDGYRFKGGDPADPNSWEKVQ